MGLLLEACHVTAVGCTFVEMERGGFKAEGKAFFLPIHCKISHSKTEEAGAIQSSIEAGQNKCFFPKLYS